MEVIRAHRDGDRRGIHGLILPVGDLAQSDEENDGTARVVTPLLSIELLQSWLKTCSDTHGPECQPKISDTPQNLTLHRVESRSIHDIPGFMLLDLVEDRVVNVIDHIDKYAALSYVWGVKEQPRLLLENLQALTQKGGLSTLKLAKTIKDACMLTTNLGVRYLWVDSLCIIQDSQAHRDFQIRIMYHVYSQASFTIVAACGDSCHYGLAGVSIPRPSRDSVYLDGLQLYSVEIAPNYVRPRIDHRWSVLSLATSAWNTRGWTFQEDVCSTRIIFLTDTMALFACQKARWREDIHLETRNSFNFNPLRPTKPPSEVHPFHRYLQYIEQYQCRKFTNPEDILDAYAGFEIWAFPWLGQCFSGMPSSHLPRAMLWRINTGRSKTVVRRDGFSSWSWAGWIFEDLSFAEKSKLPPCDWSLAWESIAANMIIHFFHPLGLSRDAESAKRNSEAYYQSSTHPLAAHAHFRYDAEFVRKYASHIIHAYRDPKQLLGFFTSAAMLLVSADQQGAYLRSPVDGHIVSQLTRFELSDDRFGDDYVPEWLTEFFRPWNSNWDRIVGMSRLFTTGFLFEVVVVGYNALVDAVYWMIVRWNNGVAFRLGVPGDLGSMKQREWWTMMPQRRLVLLG